MREMFKPEELKLSYMGHLDMCDLEEIARSMNEKLNQIIESWPKVDVIKDRHGYFTATTRLMNDGTHKARLAFIEEIKKECVNHIPKIQSRQVASPMSDDPCAAALVLGCSIVCLNCGCELVAEWKTK